MVLLHFNLHSPSFVLCPPSLFLLSPVRLCLSTLTLPPPVVAQLEKMKKKVEYTRTEGQVDEQRYPRLFGLVVWIEQRE